MKQYFALLLVLFFLFSAGCAKEPNPESEPVNEPVTEAEVEPESEPGITMIGNPWKSWSSLKEAEEAVGFSFDLPETIADTYTATDFRTMSSESPLLEVLYRDSDYTVTVRKSAGEGEDISGVYGYDFTEEFEWTSGRTYTICRERQGDGEDSSLCIILDWDGYSWSLFAPNGFCGDSLQDFLLAIYGDL